MTSDRQLQREFAVARQIHAGMRGDSQEVVLPAPPEVPVQGRKMAIRIGVAFMILMFVNVGIGLWFIFSHESKNPNRPLLEAQMREQIAKSIERAASLTPAPNVLGVTEITIEAETGNSMPSQIKWLQLFPSLEDLLRKVFLTRAASAFLSISPEVGNLNFAVRSHPFRKADRRSHGFQLIARTGSPTPATDEKKSFILQIAEAKKE